MKGKVFDQQKHPELRAGERWVTNSLHRGSEVRWISTRVGLVAYNASGEVMPQCVPVFALISEIDGR